MTWRVTGLWALFVSNVVLVGAIGTTWSYWKLWQGEPRIEAKVAPVRHAGLGFPDDPKIVFVSGAPTPPTAHTTFRAGEKLWIWRYDCFFNKVTGLVQAKMVGDKGFEFAWEAAPPPKLTPSGACSPGNFSRIIPRGTPPDWYTYKVEVIFFKNLTQPQIRTPFPPVRFRVVE